MTLVVIDLQQTIFGGFGPVSSGLVEATYWAGNRAYQEVAGAEVRFPKTLRMVTTGEPVTLDMVPTLGVSCVRWTVQNRTGGQSLTRFTEIPDVGTIDFGDLIDVDPATFQPSEEGQAAWDAAVAAAQAAVSGAVAARDEAVDAAGAAVPAAASAVEAAALAVPAAADATGAAVEAVAAAVQVAEHAAEVLAVPTTSDGIMAVVLGDEESASRQLVTARPRGGSVTLDALPELLDNSWRYNVAAYSHDNIVTLLDGTQYAVWIRSSDRHAMIGKRNVDTGSAWETFDLRTIVGDPFGLQDQDGHNTFAIGVDSVGNIHLSGNLHNDALRYAVTTVPGDITSFVAGTMVGTLESSGTYPEFFTVTDGTLFFAYRDGASGAGNFVLNRYDTTTGTWVRVGVILSGTETADSPYPNRFAPDPTMPRGIHVFYTWRATPTASSNEDICYAYTPDGGVTWRTSTGAALPAPITRAASEVVLEKPSGSGIMNQSGAYGDDFGHPHAAFTWYDTEGHSQYFHVRHDGDDWSTDQVSAFDQRIETIAVGTVDLTVARPQIFTVGSRVWILGRCKGIGQNGALLIDATPGADHKPAILAAGDLTEWEPAFDSRGLRERGELRFLLTDLSDPGPAWNAEPAGIFTLPVHQLDWALGAGTGVRKEDLRLAAEPPAVGRKAGVLSSIDLNLLNGRGDQGRYQLLSSGTYTNLPVGAALPAVLDVQWASPSVLVQTLQCASQQGSWYRSYVTGAWTAWFGVAPRLATPSAGTSVRDLADGSYHLDNARTYPDRPTGAAGNAVMTVVTPGTTSAAVRIAIVQMINGTGTWISYRVNGVWSTWVRTQGTGTVAGGTDIATLEEGTYLLTSAPSTAYVNLPAGAVGVACGLEVMTLTAGIRLYRITTLTRTSAWEATYQSSALSAWVQTRGA